MNGDALRALFHRAQLTLIAGPCVIESAEHALGVAEHLAATADEHQLPIIFKASFDKANRTSASSFRGPGLSVGLNILARIRETTKLPILTDIHLPEQAALAAEVVDVLQIPAFLCRQTDLLAAAAATGKPINVKKGQFMAPQDMAFVVEKLRVYGAKEVAVTERGTSFGYHNLVVDMRGLTVMERTTNAAVIFDATHSVQRPSAGDGKSGGDRLEALPLCRAAVAVGVDGVFCEVHPDPDRALSDGPNALTYELFDALCRQVRAIDAARRQVLPPEKP